MVSAKNAAVFPLFFPYAACDVFSNHCVFLCCHGCYLQGLFHLGWPLLSPLVFLKGSTCIHFWTCRLQLLTNIICSRYFVILCLLAVKLFELYILFIMFNRISSLSQLHYQTHHLSFAASLVSLDFSFLIFILCWFSLNLILIFLLVLIKGCISNNNVEITFWNLISKISPFVANTRGYTVIVIVFRTCTESVMSSLSLQRWFLSDKTLYLQED